VNAPLGVGVSGLPRGTTVTMSGSLGPGSPAAVLVQVGHRVRPSTYKLTFRGSLGGTSKQAKVTLVVTRKTAPVSLFGYLARAQSWRSLTRG
jgi:hypothetical protein